MEKNGDREKFLIYIISTREHAQQNLYKFGFTKNDKNYIKERFETNIINPKFLLSYIINAKNLELLNYVLSKILSEFRHIELKKI